MRMFVAQNGKCYLCGEQMCTDVTPGKPPPSNYATVDHIVPLVLGGANDRSNLALACRECNDDKGDLTADEYRDYRQPEFKRKPKS